MSLDPQVMAAILENLPVAVIVADERGRVTFANEETARVLGHSVDHLDGVDAYGSLFGLDANGGPLAREDYPLARAIGGETVAATDYKYRRPDGTVVWLRAVAAPIIQDGRRCGASVLFRNIDHEKAAAEELRNAERRLDLAVAASLREADRRKDQFLAALSHELRSPLGAISSALHVLRLQDDAPPRSVRALAVIERQVDQISRLVDDLLEVARIAEGKVDLHLHRVDAATIAASAAETVRPRMDARKQTLMIDTGPEPVFVEGDVQRLTQVIVNLLSNASKYTDEGGEVSVTLRPTGRDAEIVVRDTGIGIPLEMQAHIFDPFMQVDEHRGRSEGGLGLGLALVQRLTRLHGGDVEVRSDGPGKGSEFVVRLPLVAVGLDAGVSG